ncbi:MAG: sulfate adenylyltransferase, partial [Chloroflexota bacterium]
MPLVNPHGPAKRLKPLLLTGAELEGERARAASMPRIRLTSRETSDLIMMAIGAFTPLEGFMSHDDWMGVCDHMAMADGLFWPVPITLSVDASQAERLPAGSDVALIDDETGELMGSLRVEDAYRIDKAHECRQVFKTTDEQHPGVAKVLAQGEINLAGPVKVFSESFYPETYNAVYFRPDEVRRMFEERGWQTVAAFQTRNPMHRSHEYLVKLA